MATRNQLRQRCLLDYHGDDDVNQSQQHRLADCMCTLFTGVQFLYERWCVAFIHRRNYRPRNSVAPIEKYQGGSMPFLP